MRIFPISEVEEEDAKMQYQNLIKYGIYIVNWLRLYLNQAVQKIASCPKVSEE